MTLTLLLLFGFLFGILAAVGYYFELSGYLVVGLAVFLIFLQWVIGPKIIWWTTNMKSLGKSEYPWLWETVEEISKKKGVPMPKLALARIGAPNAFVFGRTPGSATLTVTQGLLNSLTKDEVKAVVAHEMGHIKHRDMVVMTIVAAVPIIAYYVAQFLIFAPKSKEERNSGAALVGIAAFAIYFISNLLVLLLSRLRESYADDFGGRATKPSLLASALAKITYGLSISKEKHENSAVHSFYIVSPLAATGEISRFSNEYADLELTENELQNAIEWEKKNPLVRIMEIFSSHPLTFRRILALKELEKKLAKSK
jgi:heat shock protein HtpX